MCYIKENYLSNFKERADSNTLRPTHLAQHVMDPQGNSPIELRYYHVSPKIRKIINKEIKRLLAGKRLNPQTQIVQKIK